MSDLAGGLPDSRTREQRGQIRTPHGLATPVYCVNCGKAQGYTYASTEFMFYLCDDCDKHGTGLDLPVVDERAVRDAARGGS